MARRSDTDIWNAGTYRRFADERSRPFADLLARVGATKPMQVVDLGCGHGSGLVEMGRRWPAADLIGVDSSTDMLAAAALAAKTELGPRSNITLIHAEAQSWTPPTAVDVVVSNALLQWIPDHRDLLSRMAGWLSPEGWLAMQVPGNFRAPSHTLLRELANSPQWTDKLGGILRGTDSVLDPADYHHILTEDGLTVDAWETTYLHVLTGLDPVLSWMSGTALRPVLAGLDAPDADAFTGRYAERLRAAYPPDGAGRVIFPFRRIFAVGKRGSSPPSVSRKDSA